LQLLLIFKGQAVRLQHAVNHVPPPLRPLRSNSYSYFLPPVQRFQPHDMKLSEIYHKNE